MRRCPRCERILGLDEFHVPAGGRPHGYCRCCRREYNREWYRRRREEHIANVRANTERYMVRNRAYVDGLKAAPCMDCGGSFSPPVMEFDHVRGEKINDVSVLVRSGASLATIRSEIAKCDLVCANCHRVRTARRSWPGRL